MASKSPLPNWPAHVVLIHLLLLMPQRPIAELRLCSISVNHLFFMLLTYVSMQVPVWEVHMHPHTYTCEGQRITMGVVPPHIPCLLKKGSLNGLGATNLGQASYPVRPRVPPVCAALVALQAHSRCLHRHPPGCHSDYKGFV